jgi:hypothetical protein
MTSGNIKEALNNVEWESVAENMNEKGYSIVPGFLSESDCNTLIAGYNNNGSYRKTISMERYRFGKGEYKYFSYPLPGLLQGIREFSYPWLAPIANDWMKKLQLEIIFPETFEELQSQCKTKGQIFPTALILKYGKGGFNTLHQDLYGDIFFPLQIVLFLNEPDRDYSGGEFVLLEQIPRAQSKAIVLKPSKGDMLIFTTSFRPVKGTRGYYRVNMKHGVSEVLEGERHTTGIIFHDALS